MDYSLDTGVERLGVCQKMLCLRLGIFDDDLLEESKNLTIHIEKSLGADTDITVNPSIGVITIIDTDGTYSYFTLHFLFTFSLL